MKNTNKIIDFLLALFIVVALIQSCNKVNEPKIINTFDALIAKGEFPCYQKADSIHGIDSRGTDSWVEEAYCNCNNMNKDKNINSCTFDYHINIYNDTVWLYNETGKLLIKGKFDSIPEFIILDNL